ncbi:MAG: hypothetical protein ACKO4A_09085 [Gammaproteobacteria bacterium]
MHVLRQRPGLAIALAALAAFLLAKLRNPLLNDDGVLYLQLAERITGHGLLAAFDTFDRPFYAALIAALGALPGVGLQAAAQLLGAATVVALALGFARFAALLYEDSRIVPWAMLLLLLHPKLHNYFAYVCRDLGYWAALLWSFVFLLQHLESPRRAMAGGWLLCTLLAALFRPEALLFGAAVPLLLLARPAGGPGALERGVLALGALLSLAGALAFLAILWRAPDMDPGGFRAASERLALHVLDPQSRAMAPLSLGAGLLVILLFKVLNTLGPVQIIVLLRGFAGLAPADPRRARALLIATVLTATLIALGGWLVFEDTRAAKGALLLGLALASAGLLRETCAIPQARRGAWTLLLLTALVAPLGFVFLRQFLDARYVMLAVLLLLVPTARVLQRLAEGARTAGGRRLVAFLVLATVLFAVDFAVRSDRQKAYLRECAASLPQTVAGGARVFSNDRQLAWASGLGFDIDQIGVAEQRIAEGTAPLDGVSHWILHRKRDRAGGELVPASYRERLEPLRTCSGPRGAEVRVSAVLPAAAARRTPER